MSGIVMSDAAKTARREYYREWAARNKDKVKARMARYWERKAAEYEQQAEGEQRGEGAAVYSAGGWN